MVSFKCIRRAAALTLALSILLISCGKKVDHNQTEGSNLGHWGRALSAVLMGRYSDLSTGWFGGLEKNGQARCAEILEGDFNIEDREGLIRELQFSLRSGAREDYHYDADALLLLEELPQEERDEAMEALSAEGRRRYEQVAAIYADWGELGLLGWDMARVSLLAQLGYTAGLLTHAEAQAVIEPAAVVAKSYFTDWETFSANVVDGEALMLPSEEVAEARSAWLASLYEQEDEKDPLLDDSLFEQDITPLEELSHTALLG